MRTRFAPSPTGFLHVGGARTALFCYLQSRHEQGVFILRIEDTDLERSTPESVQAILDGMDWLGLDYDEGPLLPDPTIRPLRRGRATVVGGGQGLPCFCSKERIEALREEQMKQGLKPRYDGHCRDGAEPVPGVKPVVRFRNPPDGDVVFDDLVRGRISISNTELDDLVIARPDGSPTYNFTVVVDDVDMAVTLVIRGDDHINNTPRQINIYRALGADLPDFAHVPMILGDDGARLSKRHGAVGVMQYRDDGYLPQALLNYLVRLGWSHGDQEIFSREEMIEQFDIRDVNRKAAAFNTDKLDWLNQHYMRTLPAAEVARASRLAFRTGRHRPGLRPATGGPGRGAGRPRQDAEGNDGAEPDVLRRPRGLRRRFGEETSAAGGRSSRCAPSATAWPIWPPGSRSASTRRSASRPRNWKSAWARSPSRCAWR